jgi:hypothetical protein
MERPIAAIEQQSEENSIAPKRGFLTRVWFGFWIGMVLQPLGLHCFTWCLFNSGLGPTLGYTLFVGVAMVGLLLPNARFIGGILVGSTVISFIYFLALSWIGFAAHSGPHLFLNPYTFMPIALLSGFDNSVFKSFLQSRDILRGYDVLMACVLFGYFTLLCFSLWGALFFIPKTGKGLSRNSGMTAHLSSTSKLLYLCWIGASLASLTEILSLIPWDTSKLWIAIPVTALAGAIGGPGYAAGAGVVFFIILMGAFKEAGLVALIMVAFGKYKQSSNVQRTRLR